MEAPREIYPLELPGIMHVLHKDAHKRQDFRSPAFEPKIKGDCQEFTFVKCSVYLRLHCDVFIYFLRLSLQEAFE